MSAQNQSENGPKVTVPTENELTMQLADEYHEKQYDSDGFIMDLSGYSRDGFKSAMNYLRGYFCPPFGIVRVDHTGRKIEFRRVVEQNDEQTDTEN